MKMSLRSHNKNKMKKITTLYISIFISLIPFLVSAQTSVRNLKDVVDVIVVYFNYAIQLIIGFAIVMFVWNVYKYFIASGDDVLKKKEAGLYVMWSVIGFFVIISIWGLVRILLGTFNLNSYAPNTFFGNFGTGVITAPSDRGSSGIKIKGGTTAGPNSGTEIKGGTVQ